MCFYELIELTKLATLVLLLMNFFVLNQKHSENCHDVLGKQISIEVFSHFRNNKKVWLMGQ